MGLRLDARDGHYYGGALLVAVGAGLRWGLPIGLIVAGAALLLAVMPTLWRANNGAT